MNFGFDLDKVFIDYPPFVPARFIDKLYKRKSNGTLLYRIPNKPEQILRRLTHFHLFRPPIKKNIKFLQNLPQTSTHKYYLISSRFSFLKRETQMLIKRHKFDNIFHGLFFNFDNEQPHIFKDRILKKLKIDKYVDDDLELLQYVAKKNPSIKFFWLTPYHVSFSDKRIQQIHDLSEIL